jgi:SAM-dependent methyltransferase
VKKLLHHIHNFFYLAVNWNPLLAAFVAWQEAKRGRKYGLHTIKRESLQKYSISEGDISKSSPYEAINFFILEYLLENFRRLFPKEKNIMDVGCGKGRVLAAAAYFGFTGIKGVDFAKELCEEAERNMEKIKPAFPAVQFKIAWSNILHHPLAAEDKVFFLFNPFNDEVLEKFVAKIEASVKEHPRSIWFIYASPKHIDVLLEKGYVVIYRVKKMKFLEGLIAVKPLDDTGSNKSFY